MAMEVDCPPQLTREHACPNVFMRVEMLTSHPDAPTSDKLLKHALHKAVQQLFGKMNSPPWEMLHAYPADASPGGWTVTGLIKTGRGNVEKVSAACACASSFADYPVQLKVLAAAPTLSQLAVWSKDYVLSHCMPLLQ